MPTSETRYGASRRNGHSTLGELGELRRFGRSLPRKVRHEMDTHPEVLLGSVAAAFFALGAVLGSRLGRAILVAAVPIGLERLIAGQLGPKLLGYVKKAWSEAEGTTRRGEA